MEILQEAVKTYDFGWDVSQFAISTYHFMVRFEELPKKVSIYCCVLKAPMLKCRK